MIETDVVVPGSKWMSGSGFDCFSLTKRDVGCQSFQKSKRCPWLSQIPKTVGLLLMPPKSEGTSWAQGVLTLVFEAVANRQTHILWITVAAVERQRFWSRFKKIKHHFFTRLLKAKEVAKNPQSKWGFAQKSPARAGRGSAHGSCYAPQTRNRGPSSS